MTQPHLAPITRKLGLTFDTCECGHVVWAHYYASTGICAHCACKQITDPRTHEHPTVDLLSPIDPDRR